MFFFFHLLLAMLSSKTIIKENDRDVISFFASSSKIHIIGIIGNCNI